jgi:hypothetical protein
VCREQYSVLSTTSVCLAQDGTHLEFRSQNEITLKLAITLGNWQSHLASRRNLYMFNLIRFLSTLSISSKTKNINPSLES